MDYSLSIKHFSDLNITELYKILQIRNLIFIIEQDCHYIDLDDKDQNAHHVMLWDNEKLIGYTRLLAAGTSYQNYCSIGRVAVDATYRGKNLGKKIMEVSIAKCKELYPEKIKISAQQYLEKFYTDLGFETIGEMYLEDDIPHVPMLLMH